MKAHFFSPILSILSFSLLATFNFTCDTKCLLEVVRMRVLSIYVSGALALALNSFMSAATNIAPVAICDHRPEELGQSNLLRPYSEIFSYLLKKFSNDKAIAKMDSTFLRYTKATIMTWLYCSMLMTYISSHASLQTLTMGSTLSDIFVARVGSLICHSLRKNWAKNSQINLADIVFKDQSLLEIQKRSTKSPDTVNRTVNAKQYGKRSLSRNTTNVVDTGSATSSTSSSCRCSNCPTILASSSPTPRFTWVETLSSSSALLSLSTLPCKVCYDPAHSTMSSLCYHGRCYSSWRLYTRGA